MAEVKKRWRPSLTAYRTLESELFEYKKRFDDLAEKERFEAKAYSNLERAYNELLETCNAQRSHIHALEHSNTSLERGLKDERKLRNGAVEDYNKARQEVLQMRNRNLWQRIINK